ncbi:MAG TPA: Na+/H+ antiporter NhaC family protein [Rubrobacter sp.]|nr:Na+/H+ antiporter NhaC family protein [Rubrobacter sp.]
MRHWKEYPARKRRIALVFAGFLLVLTAFAALFNLLLSQDVVVAQENGDYSIELPQVVLTGVPFSVEVSGAQPEGEAPPPKLMVAGESYKVDLSGGSATVEDITVSEMGQVSVALVQGEQEVAQQSTSSIPGWLSVLPPLLAIAMALITREVISSLFIGIYAGAVLTYGLGIGSLWSGLLDTLQVYVVEAIAPPSGDASHAQILIFSLMIGGMVGIISKNGGMRGVVNRIIGLASTPKRGQTTTGILGLAIFFDDYTNTLVVGNTMRAVTDRLRVSREKLAYLVDSTAAPVASIALITTWIGFEIGLIGDAVGGIQGFDQEPYAIFLSSIPYAFYPVLAIFLVFAVAISGRDFGPMYKAERRARSENKVLRDDADVDSAAAGGEEMEPKVHTPDRALNAVIPIVALIGTALAAMYVTGSGETIQDIIGSADSYAALMWASLLGVLVAAVLSLGQRILNLDEVTKAWYAGVRFMLFGMVILVLAWALSGVMEVLQTADYLVSILSANLPPAIVPALIFLLAAGMSFATGTSWGTMGVLFPLAIPLTWGVLQANEMANPANYFILYAAIRSILSGAIFGDHCSPISDTTILSSLASGCDHIDHVRTQLPYALLVGIVCVIFGLLPMGFGVPGWILLIVMVAILLAALYLLGKRVDEAEDVSPRRTPTPRPAS